MGFGAFAQGGVITHSFEKIKLEKINDRSLCADLHFNGIPKFRPVPIILAPGKNSVPSRRFVCEGVYS